MKSIKEAHTANIYEPGTGVGSAEIYIDPVKERRMMRKFDVRWHMCIKTQVLALLIYI